MGRVLLGLTFLALLSPPADACALQRYRDLIATADGTAIPDGGGVIVESTPAEAGSDDDQVVLSLRVGGKRLDTRATYIAPRLSVLSAPKGTRGTIELVDSKNRVRLRASQVASTRPLDAPSVQRITSTAGAVAAQPTKGGGNERATIRIELATPAPADAFALVLLGRDGTQPPVGRGAARVTTQRSYELWAGGCSSDVWMTRQGEAVYVAWLDVHGRLSALSTSIVVAAPSGAVASPPAPAPATTSPPPSPVTPPPMTTPPPQAKLKGYVRAARGTPPGDPARVRTFVASAAWQPVYEVPEGAKRPATPPLWLIDVTRPRRGVKGDRDAIREIVERDGARLIVTDLAVFELAACTDRKNAACLTPRPDLPGHRANLDNERRQHELRDLRTKLK